MTKPYLMGLDAGTTIVKSVVFDQKGKSLAVASRRLELEHPKPGWAEHDMLSVWNAAKRSIREALERAHASPQDVAGLGLSGMGASLWLIDGRGKPVRKAITWLDSRSKHILDEWRESGLSEHFYDITGWRLFTGIGPPILYPWLKENEPKSLERARWCLRAKDWIRYRLTGEICSDESDMSVGLFEVGRREYSQKVLDLCRIEDYAHTLPRLTKSWEISGEVTSGAAKETGLNAGTPVATGAYDVCSTALGAGAIEVGQALAIVGTAGIYNAISDKAILDKQRKVACGCHCVPDKWMLNCQAMLAGPNLDWFLDKFYSFEKSEATKKRANIYGLCNRLVERVPPGSLGIIYHPFLEGEIGPFVKPTARAGFFGIGAWHKREHLLRAVYEGVAYSMRDNFIELARNFEGTGIGISEVRLTGGGARSPAWTRILSDVTGHQMRMPLEEECGCLGAAMNAGIAVGLFRDHREAVDKAVRIRGEVAPSKEAWDKYSALFAIYRRLYQAVSDEWDRLYDVVGTISS